jgi:site-specific recombinase XerD
LDFENNTILLRKCKGNRDLTVPMNKNDMQRIKSYIDNQRPKPNNGYEEYLFITNSGKKVYEYRIHRVLQYCAKELGFKIRVHPHALRRARVLDLRKQNYEWEEIIKITGHRKIEYLMPYLLEEDFNKVHRKLNQQDTISNSPPPREKTTLDKELELLKAQLVLERLKNENLKMTLNGVGKAPEKLDADPLGYGNYDTY